MQAPSSLMWDSKNIIQKFRSTQWITDNDKQRYKIAFILNTLWTLLKQDSFPFLWLHDHDLKNCRVFLVLVCFVLWGLFWWVWFFLVFVWGFFWANNLIITVYLKTILKQGDDENLINWKSVYNGKLFIPACL